MKTRLFIVRHTETIGNVEKRLTGKPSQMVCICTNKGIKAYYPIELT